MIQPIKLKPKQLRNISPLPKTLEKLKRQEIYFIFDELPKRRRIIKSRKPQSTPGSGCPGRKNQPPKPPLKNCAKKCQKLKLLRLNSTEKASPLPKKTTNCPWL